jgi:hypothetical protein
MSWCSKICGRKKRQNHSGVASADLFNPLIVNVTPVQTILRDSVINPLGEGAKGGHQQVVEHQSDTWKHLERAGHDHLQLMHTCMATGCFGAIDKTVCGSAYCTAHEHHPLGKASFEVVRQVLIDIRESTGFAGWGNDYLGQYFAGWDALETYTTMQELCRMGQAGDVMYEGGVYGVEVEDGKLVTLDLRHCNLTGTFRSLSANSTPHNAHTTVRAE